MGNPTPSDPPAIRIVLVEDDNVLRQGLADYLRLSGFEVTDVTSGLTFYKELRRHHFDVAILDVNLPDANGFELARDVRDEGTTGIIILTARTSSQDRVRAYQDGADVYLAKPVDGAELALAVRNLAERVRGAMPAVPSAEADWQLFLVKGQLRSAQGGIVRLTTRESLLLEILIDADGAVVSRDRLEAALGYEDKPSPGRGLDAMVRRLRTKAAASGLDLPLQNVHSIGLRFVGRVIKS